MGERNVWFLRLMVVLVGVGLRKSWLVCMNDDMRKFGLKKDDTR